MHSSQMGLGAGSHLAVTQSIDQSEFALYGAIRLRFDSKVIQQQAILNGT
jgi:hypothetical protein